MAAGSGRALVGRRGYLGPFIFVLFFFYFVKTTLKALFDGRIGPVCF